MSQVEENGQILKEQSAGTGPVDSVSAPKDAPHSTEATQPKKRKAEGMSDAEKWRAHMERQKKYSKRYQDKKRAERAAEGVHRYGVLFPRRAFVGQEGKATLAVSDNYIIGGYVFQRCKLDNGEIGGKLKLYDKKGKLLTEYTLDAERTRAFPQTPTK